MSDEDTEMAGVPSGDEADDMGGEEGTYGEGTVNSDTINPEEEHMTEEAEEEEVKTDSLNLLDK